MCIRIISAIIDGVAYIRAYISVSLTNLGNRWRAKKDANDVGPKIVYATTEVTANAEDSALIPIRPCTRNVQKWCNFTKAISCVQLMAATGPIVNIYVVDAGVMYYARLDLENETANGNDIPYGEFKLLEYLVALK